MTAFRQHTRPRAALSFFATLLAAAALAACGNSSDDVAPAEESAPASSGAGAAGHEQHTTTTASATHHHDTASSASAGQHHDTTTLTASDAAGADGSNARLSTDQETALATLAAASRPLDHAQHGAHPHGHTFGPAEEVPLNAADSAVLDAEWAVAAGAAAGLAGPEDGAAAGYVQASVQLPGVGAHWVKWTLVDTPFDPATPSMLLYDQTELRPHTLAGFSYWVRSEAAPEGFAGPNDVWHQHAGLCFVNGWLVGEDVPAAPDCAGHWLNGADLWMLHAWVVPEFANTWGRFAARNPALCPPDSAQLPDLLTCDPEVA